MTPFKTITFALFLLFSVGSFAPDANAQTPGVGTVYETVRAVFPGNPDQFTVTISPADSSKTVAVNTYYVTGSLAPTSAQPTVTRAGLVVTIRFNNVSVIPAQARVKLKFNGVVIQVWRYDVAENNTTMTAPSGITIVNQGVGPSELPAYLSQPNINAKANRTGLDSANTALQTRLAYVVSSGLFTSATADVVQFDNASWERKAGTVTSSSPGFGGMIFAGPTGFYYARKYSGAVDITWMGAQSGATDNAAAIQATINFIPNTTAARGGEIYIPTGFFDVATKIVLPVNVRLKIRGNGTSQYNESGGSGSVLRWTGASGGVMMEYDGGASTRHNGPTIEGVNFYTADATSTLLRFRFVTHWTVQNCSFKNGGTAFELDAGIGVAAGNDNAWGLWKQNVILDQANYGIKVTNGTYGFLMEGGDTQVAMNAVGVYIDEYSQHVRLIGTKHDRGNPAIWIKGGHTHLVGVSIENATKGIAIDRVATTYSGGTSVFSGKFNQVTASSIVGWAGTETGMTLGAGTAANVIQFEGVNLAARLIADGQVDSYSLFTNGIWRLQNRLSSIAVQEYNIGTTLAAQMFASGNGLIIGGTSGGKNVILRPATTGGVQIQKPDGTIMTNFNEDGTGTVRGTLRSQFGSGSGAPTGTDIAPGYFLLWKNTSDGTTKWYLNDGGTIKSGAAFN